MNIQDAPTLISCDIFQFSGFNVNFFSRHREHQVRLCRSKGHNPAGEWDNQFNDTKRPLVQTYLNLLCSINSAYMGTIVVLKGLYQQKASVYQEFRLNEKHWHFVVTDIDHNIKGSLFAVKMVIVLLCLWKHFHNWLHFHFPSIISCFSSSPALCSAAETSLSFQLNLKEYNLV